MYRMAIAVTLCVTLLSGLPTKAQESEPEDTIYPDDNAVPSVKCIRPKMIKSTRVVNAKNILFYMRSGKVYRNVLPRNCLPLVQGSMFSYNITYGRVCDVDNLTIIGGSNSGNICPLGKFYPLNKRELGLLIREIGITEDLGLENEPET